MPRLVGRQTETNVVNSALRDARAGRSQCILIQGEPGIGKTALVEDAKMAAAALGYRTVIARCEEADPRPLAPLLRATADLASATDGGRLVIATEARGDLTSGAGVATPGYREAARTAAFIERAAIDGPVMFVVEDVHWADELTLLAIHLTLRGSEGLPLISVITHRPLPKASQIAKFRSRLIDEGAIPLSLQPLDLGSIRQVVEQASLPPLDDHSLKGAGGNPFLALELARAAGAGVASSSLREAVIRRFGALDGEAGSVITLASALGTSIDPEELAAVAELSLARLMRFITAAADAQLVVDEPDGIRFVHDLVRQVIYAELGPATRRGVHRRIAQALESVGSPALRVAMHYAECARRGDDDAVKWLVRGADEAERLSYASALAFVDRALELALPGERQEELLTRRFDLLVHLGRADEAEQLGRDLWHTVAGVARRAWVGHGLAGLLINTRRWREAIALCEATLAMAEIPPKSVVWARNLLAECHLSTGNLDAAAELVTDTGLLAARQQLFDGLQRALSLGSQISRARGSLARAVQEAREAVAVPAQNMATWTFAHLTLGCALVDSDRLPEAKASFEHVMASAEEVGHTAATVWSQWYLSFSCYVSGSWDYAMTYAESSLRLTSDAGRPSGVLLPMAIIARIRLHRDDAAEADRAVLHAMDIIERHGNDIGTPLVRWVEALLRDREGRPDLGAVALRRIWSRQEASLGLWHGLIATDTVRVALGAGDHELAERAAGACESAAALTEAASARGAALSARALISGSAEMMTDACPEYESSGRVVELMAAKFDAARLFALGGKREEAATWAMATSEVAADLGALYDAERAAAIAPAAKRGRPRQRAKLTGWESLTDAELVVAGLVAEGLTNPQIAEKLIIARSTVHTHLLHVFAKLGCTSRAQVAVIASRELTSRH